MFYYCIVYHLAAVRSCFKRVVSNNNSTMLHEKNDVLLLPWYKVFFHKKTDFYVIRFFSESFDLVISLIFPFLFVIYNLIGSVLFNSCSNLSPTSVRLAVSIRMTLFVQTAIMIFLRYSVYDLSLKFWTSRIWNV